MKWELIETAPKDGTVVDLWGLDKCYKGDKNKARRYANCKWVDLWDDDEMAGWEQEYAEIESFFKIEGITVTHWMSLSDPPSQ